MRRRRLDRALVAGLAVLVAAVAADALIGRSDSSSESAPPPSSRGGRITVSELQVVPAPRPSRVSLRGSPETAFLRTCSLDRLSLEVELGTRLVVTYVGPPCHLPELGLTGAVRDTTGHWTTRRPVLDDSGLRGNVAGDQTLVVPLASDVLRCRRGPPDNLRSVDGGRRIVGEITCVG